MANAYRREPATRGDRQRQAGALNDLGIGLNQQDKHEDAIPVLRRCISLYPETAGCWYELGEALLALGNVEGARESYRSAIQTGGFDEANAAAIGAAKRRLAQLPEIPQERKGEASRSFGTGFFVSSDGHVLTNNHVVAQCKRLTTREGAPLHVVSRKPIADLALLKADSAAVGVAVFRSGPSPKAGDAVVAFGFPLPDLLSSEGNVSTGVISAVSGLRNDVRFVQISAPVQPGNSGGPLLDSSGHVIGVVVAKLDALHVAEVTGDVPQNVNFAIHWSEVRAFLDEEGVLYQKAASQQPISTRTITAAASRMSVAIECVE